MAVLTEDDGDWNALTRGLHVDRDRLECKAIKEGLKEVGIVKFFNRLCTKGQRFGSP